MAITIDCVAGSDAGKTLTLTDRNGDAVTTYTDATTLAAECWSGDDQASLFSPAVAWVDSSAATLRIECSAAQTADLAPGRYPILLEVTTTGQTVKRVAAYLEVAAAPGTAEAPPVYGTFLEMLRFAPWIGDLQGEGDTAGFLDQRARARSYLDDAIVNRDRPFTQGRSGQTLGDPGFGGNWSNARFGDLGPSQWLVDYLAADALLVRSKTTEIVARLAIAYVCEAQLGSVAETPYQKLAATYRLQAENLLRGYTAELDTNSDGVADYWVRLGVASDR
jgi:hypothetical protein